MYEIKIPKARIAVLIGEKGTTKRLIEKVSGTKLRIDSEEGDVIISSEESLNAFTTQDVVKAIGRGFNPEIALKIIRENKVLEIVDMDSFAKTKNHLMRIKARIIGREGKIRIIELEMNEGSIFLIGVAKKSLLEMKRDFHEILR